MKASTTAAAMLASLAFSQHAVAAEATHTNRLIHEKSPYLLQHAHNPVDWYPWGKESFENSEIAKLMNDNFVNIKVDREERPDIDQVYMTFVQATTGGGGWPMNVFLTSELKPFFGGTYFPPEDKWGQPGLTKVLTKIAGAWKADREHILA